MCEIDERICRLQEQMSYLSVVLVPYSCYFLQPIREGDFIIQPRVDFDISVRTVAGLLALGYTGLRCMDLLVYAMKNLCVGLRSSCSSRPDHEVPCVRLIDY